MILGHPIEISWPARTAGSQHDQIKINIYGFQLKTNIEFQ